MKSRMEHILVLVLAPSYRRVQRRRTGIMKSFVRWGIKRQTQCAYYSDTVRTWIDCLAGA